MAGDATAAFMALARRLGAPVTTTANGRGALDDRDPLALLPVAGREVMADADVVLLVGSRGMTQRGRPFAAADGATLIHLTLEERDLGAPRSPDVAIVADAAAGLTALLDRLDGPNRGCWASAEQLSAARAGEQEALAKLQPQWSYSQALRRAMPDDAILVNELTQVGYVSMVGFPVHHPRSYLWPGFQGTLGYGYPTALGAKVGNPTGPWCRSTATAASATAWPSWPPPPRNASGWWRWCSATAPTATSSACDQQFDGVHLGTELTNPDWVALARSFGVHGERVTDPEGLERAVRDAIDADRPALIEVPMPPTPDPWRLILG
ncbi:MAG: thiamine pyrophosphate-dependent enzyme [Acidimicrobiales bacterium]